MLSYKAEIPWHQSLSNLTRFHTTISGINQRYQIIQVDTRNHLVDKTLTFIDKNYQFPTINDCKYINSNLNSTYYFTFADKIVGASGQIVDQSNSKADFVRGLDGSKDLFAFAKFHKIHHKYSLNLKKIGNEKQILGLFDSQIDKIGLLHEKQGCAVVLQTIDENVRLFYGEDCSIQQEMARIDKFTIDHNYIYMMSVADKRSSPPKNNHFNSNNSVQYNREFGKIRLQAYEKQKITKGKGYSQFEFNLPKYPLKIDSFQTDIIIAFENSLEIYDIRKITKPFQKQNEGGIKDFYYEPNLQKIFLSSRKGILVFDYK